MVLITAKSLKAVSTLFLTDLLTPLLEPTLLRVCLHHSIKAALDLAKVNCQIQWSGSVFSYLPPCKNWILFSSNHLLHMPSKNSPSYLTSLLLSASPAGSSTFFFFFFKKKLTSQCWILMNLHSLKYTVLSPIFYFHGFKWQLNLRNHKYKYFI